MSFKNITTHLLKTLKLMSLCLIMSGCSMFGTSSTINTYCQTYIPVRNYLAAPQAVIEQIERNNNRYLCKCLNDCN